MTCVQHPLDRILKYGFSAGHGESRPAKRVETASILGCISLETAQNEMHGGQAIPAFDFYLAPYVRNSFIEEVKTLEDLYGQDFSHLYNKPIDDYLTQTLDGLSGDRRVIQHAINRTVSRVHQSMEAFIHNRTQSIPVEATKCIQLHQLWNRHLGGRSLHHPGVIKKYLQRRR